MKPLLFLIGYRGSGKTSAGQRVSAGLGWQFLDADAVLEAKFGQSIREIFAEEGELGFRAKEAEVLRELSALQDHVIATGGGIILREENRAILRTHGRVVWLKADAFTLWQRIQGDPTTSARGRRCSPAVLPRWNNCWQCASRSTGPVPILKSTSLAGRLLKWPMLS